MKRLTVFDVANLFSSESDIIPVKIMHGLELVASAKSLDWLSTHAGPAVLERKIRNIALKKDEIIVQVRDQTVNFKI